MQVGPHAQVSPHGQAFVLASAWTFWQPHWQAAPARDEQEHVFELVGMMNLPFNLVDLLSTRKSFAPKPPSFIERSGYCPWMNPLFWPGHAER